MIHAKFEQALAEGLKAIECRHEVSAVMNAASALRKPIPGVTVMPTVWSSGLQGQGGYEFNRDRIPALRSFIAELEAAAQGRAQPPSDDAKGKPSKKSA